MLPRRLVIAVLFASALVALPGPAVPVQAATDIFDTSVLHEVRIFMNSRELPQLRAGFLENNYYPADFQWGSERVRNVAVRSRGSGSRLPNKLGLRIDFNRLTTGQTFQGLKALDLDNLSQDPSMMREYLAMELFRRMGQPASRESFCKLFINNVYQGLYAVVEEVDPTYLARHINESTGYLYEFKYTTAWFGEDLGDDLAPYKARFSPQTHELETDTQLYPPIRDMIKEINVPIDGVWRERVESRLDLNQFITHLAIEVFLAENDGLLGYAGFNNFYLYRFANTNRHRLFVWDKDNSFAFLDSRIMREADHNVFMAQMLQFPDLKTLFLDVLTQTAESAANGDWLINEINRVAGLIGEAAFTDTQKPYSNDDVVTAIDFLRTFAGFRPGYVLLDVSINR